MILRAQTRLPEVKMLGIFVDLILPSEIQRIIWRDFDPFRRARVFSELKYLTSLKKLLRDILAYKNVSEVELTTSRGDTWVLFDLTQKIRPKRERESLDKYKRYLTRSLAAVNRQSLEPSYGRIVEFYSSYSRTPPKVRVTIEVQQHIRPRLSRLTARLRRLENYCTCGSTSEYFYNWKIKLCVIEGNWNETSQWWGVCDCEGSAVRGAMDFSAYACEE